MPEIIEDPEDYDVHEEDPHNFPNAFHKKVLWTAISAVCIVLIGAIAVGSIIGTSWILGYLQPLLVPIAVAGIVAYLLEPIIVILMKRGMTHGRATTLVFLSFLVGLVILGFLVIKPAVGQIKGILSVPSLEERQRILGTEGSTVVVAPAPVVAAETTDESAETEVEEDPWLAKTKLGLYTSRALEFVDEKLSDLPFAQQFQSGDDSWDVAELSRWIWGRISGFMDEAAVFFGRGFSSAASVLGYVLGLFLVPIYLFFFLRESSRISDTWSDYIPLRNSHLKDEIVATLQEINGYLIAYFRGQMLVSIIDGVLVAIALKLIGLPNAITLGVFLAILGLIPYVGNLMVMIPAILIAFVHFSNPEMRWDWLPQVWAYPLIVLGIFVVLQQINGLVTAPKIVGDSVGLHPLTVIMSMLFWGLLLGGMLGALLAVPLTASVKVLFKRYIWQRQLDSRSEEVETAAG